MRMAALTAAAALLGDAALAQPQSPPRPSGPVQQRITPGLAAYTDEVLFGEVWPGVGLSPRDRSLVVITTLIVTHKPAQLQGHLGRALTNGVTPVEASGVLTHLALYAGWPSAVSALEVYDQVYTARKVDLAALQADLPSLPAAAAAAAAAAGAPPAVSSSVAAAAPRFADLNERVLRDDLWRRSDLNVRDRSLVTIVALAAMGEADQLPPYLRRGREAGLTQAEVSEAVTHLAFYAGWPKAAKAIEVSTRVFAGAASTAAVPAPASASNFTGAVSVTGPFAGTGGARLGGATVSFAPAARTNWHSHPLGQLLVVTEGRGWTRIEGQPARALEPGDVVWTPPGARHWHGGTRTTGLTHVAIAESDGEVVRWHEPVSDAEFQGPS